MYYMIVLKIESDQGDSPSASEVETVAMNSTCLEALGEGLQAEVVLEAVYSYYRFPADPSLEGF